MRRLIRALPVLILAACSGHAARRAPSAPAPAATPVAAPAPAPPQPRLASAYRLAIRLDPATAGLFGKKSSATMVALRELEAHPGAVLLKLAVVHGLPGSDWIGRLPGPLRDRLAGWLDEALLKSSDSGPAPLARVGQAVRDLEELGRVIVLVTELTPDGTGQHTVRGLRIAAGGRELVVPLPHGVVDALPHATAAVTRDGQTLVLGAHRFAVPVGAMLLDAHRKLVLEPAGLGSLAALLDRAVGCPALAEALARRCALGQCISGVAPVAQLTALCHAGVALAAQRLEEEVRGEKLTVLDLRQGRARLAGEGSIVTRLEDGVFTVAITVEGETANGEAPFTGEASGP